MKTALTVLLLWGCGGYAPREERHEAPEMFAARFTTSDGVPLAADFYPVEGAGAAALLLHMRPPQSNRSDYPPALIRALTERGIAVLVLDRRGAGDSGGVAQDAYRGPGGALDVAAAIEYLAHEPGIERDHIVIVGASNGTTSAIDYTIAAAADPRAVHPRGLVFLTPGEYTEAQHSVRDPILSAMRILFVYSREEREFSAALKDDAPAAWSFYEYEHGDHGTRMFAADRSSIARVADWVELASN